MTDTQPPDVIKVQRISLATAGVNELGMVTP